MLTWALAILLLQSVTALPLRTAVANVVPAFKFVGDPAYPDPPAKMASYVRCPEKFQPNQTTILLIHGTGSDAEESFGAGYARSLDADGYNNVCAVSMPQRSMGDAQDTGARVAFIMHYVSHLNGNASIAVMGHSQGNLNIQWALTFWPSTRNVVHQFIALAGGFRGTAMAKPLCLFTRCLPSIHQQSTGSNFVAALAKHGGLQPWIPTTSIYTVLDEILQPEFPYEYATSRLDQSTTQPLYVSSVQSYCPFDLTGHILLLADGVAYSIVKDALKEGTIANHDRLSAASICHNRMPKLTVSFLNELKTIAKTALAFLTGNGAMLSKDEPALKPYAL